VLVVVKDRYVQQVLKALLYFKTARRGNVFEIDTAKTDRKIGDSTKETLI